MNYNDILDLIIKEIPKNSSEKVYGITFIAGPGTGKSTIAKYISEKFGVYVTANDKIRRILEKNGIEPEQSLVEKLAEDRTVYMLENKISMIIDANMMFHWKTACNNFDKYNATLYFIKITCPESQIIKRIQERQKNWDRDSSILSRATEQDYYKFLEKCKNSDFPEDLIFYTINSNCDISEIKKQIEKMYEKFINK